MDKELERVLYNIQQKTNINIDAESIDGVTAISTNPNGIGEMKVDVNGFIDADISLGRTFFNFVFNNVKYVGGIDGISDVEKNYAYLINTLIENSQNKEQTYEQELLSIINGDYNRIKILNFMERYSIPNLYLSCILINISKGNIEELKDFLDDYSTNGFDIAVKVDDSHICYIRFYDDNNDLEYESITDFSNMVSRAMYEELGVSSNIYLGCKVDSFTELKKSYSLATSTERLSKIFGGKNIVLSYKDYILVSVLEELSEIRLKELRESLMDDKAQEIFKDSELVKTVEEFINNNLNISEAARNLYIHRNTLMYRIDKIEKITGLNISNFSDALIFKIVTIINKLI